jgi:hypothetical protein
MLAFLMHSPWLSIKALESDEEDRIMFGKVMRSIISCVHLSPSLLRRFLSSVLLRPSLPRRFVRTKLSSKGIFQNTLGFASRMLG